MELLKEVFKLSLPLDVRNRLHLLLSTLVIQGIEQREVLDGKSYSKIWGILHSWIILHGPSIDDRPILVSAL